VQEFHMFRLFVTAAALSFACGISASVAQANCDRVFVNCRAAPPQYNMIKRYAQRCQTVVLICETGSQRTAKSHLPDSELPSDQLPRSRLPDGDLPDSVLN
jgi:hypothetical protein